MMSTLMTKAMMLPLDGVIDTTNSLVDDATTTVQKVVVLAAAVFVLIILVRKQTLAATLGAAFVAGIVYWLVAAGGISVIGNLIGDDLNSAGMPPTSVVVVDSPAQVMPNDLVVVTG